MKKIILTVALLILSVFVLAACTQQKAISDSLKRGWDVNLQTLKYDIFETEQENGADIKRLIGEMSVTMQRFDKTDVKINDKELKGFSGYKTSYFITMSDGGKAVEIDSQAIFAGTKMKPQYSYKSVTVDGTLLYEITAAYTAKNYEYSLTQNGETPKSGKIKLKGTYFDNEMIFALLRTCPLEDRGSSFDFAFSVPSVLDDTSGFVDMKIVNAEGSSVKYKREDRTEKDGYTDADFVIGVDDALHFKYVPAQDLDYNGMTEMFYAKTNDLLFDKKETYIPVYIKQNNIEYIFYQAEETK
ncbi:MAG: hypothetical protein LBT30_05220 [Clostridiales bacterium]|jgi:hypothetical protein|nr:hypothetical protein [Clostridiales bacterium]